MPFSIQPVFCWISFPPTAGEPTVPYRAASHCFWGPSTRLLRNSCLPLWILPCTPLLGAHLCRDPSSGPSKAMRELLPMGFHWWTTRYPWCQVPPPPESPRDRCHQTPITPSLRCHVCFTLCCILSHMTSKQCFFIPFPIFQYKHSFQILLSESNFPRTAPISTHPSSGGPDCLLFRTNFSKMSV